MFSHCIHCKICNIQRGDFNLYRPQQKVINQMKLSIKIVLPLSLSLCRACFNLSGEVMCQDDATDAPVTTPGPVPDLGTAGRSHDKHTNGKIKMNDKNKSFLTHKLCVDMLDKP